MASNSSESAQQAFLDELEDSESLEEEDDMEWEEEDEIESEEEDDSNEEDDANDGQLALLRKAPRGRRTRGRGGRAGLSDDRATRDMEQEDIVLEVCERDSDVPPRLKKKVELAEGKRRARLMRQIKRERWQGVGVGRDDEDVHRHDISGSDTAVARKLFGGDRDALKFQWSPMTSFSGRAEKFLDNNPGPAVKVSKPYDAFCFYWNMDILNHIVRETNLYAEKLKLSSERFARTWFETNVHELMILFAYWIMLGIIRMPSVRSCFSSSPLLKTDIFRKLMTETRFWNLNRALSFVDNSTRGQNSSKIFLLGPIPDHLNSKFQKAYKLDQKLTIDESLMLWIGQVSFRQYIHTKASHVGIKAYELCESATGYIWSFVMYTGKDSAAPSELPKSMDIVVSLMKPLLNKGHQLFLDYWFNSPVLARYLKRNKTDCIGILHKYRKHVPALVQLAKIRPGTCIARHCGDVVTMVYQDIKPVYTISTCHRTESVPAGRASRYKPAVLAEYNTSMGVVDKKDQMLEPYLIERNRNRGWHKKIFKRLLNVSIFNSCILLDKSSLESVKQHAFRLELVHEIMAAHLQHVPKPRVRTTATRDVGAAPVPLEHRHFPARLDGEDLTQGGPSQGRRDCVYCKQSSRRRCRTVWICKACDVPLCIGCFDAYHPIT